ncbi:unnamed protein product [[Candida] boidinii]|nr:unnamed protein product [[Candida] boidinii]
MSGSRRCFIELKSELPHATSSISLIFDLKTGVETFPKSTENFIKLCSGQNDLQLSYKKSPVTRVISPEFLLQLGKIERRTKDKESANFLKNVVDEDEYLDNIKKGEQIDRAGLLCLAEEIPAEKNENASNNDGSETPPDSKSEFFITLASGLSKYSEMKDKYMVIGHLHSGNMEKLLDWLDEIPVDDDDRPLEPVYISRCGELILLSNNEDNSSVDSSAVDNNTDKKTKRDSNEVGALDLLFSRKKKKIMKSLK